MKRSRRRKASKRIGPTAAPGKSVERASSDREANAVYPSIPTGVFLAAVPPAVSVLGCSILGEVAAFDPWAGPLHGAFIGVVGSLVFGAMRGFARLASQEPVREFWRVISLPVALAASAGLVLLWFNTLVWIYAV